MHTCTELKSNCQDGAFQKKKSTSAKNKKIFKNLKSIARNKKLSRTQQKKIKKKKTNALKYNKPKKDEKKKKKGFTYIKILLIEEKFKLEIQIYNKKKKLSINLFLIRLVQSRAFNII